MHVLNKCISLLMKPFRPRLGSIRDCLARADMRNRREGVPKDKHHNKRRQVSVVHVRALEAAGCAAKLRRRADRHGRRADRLAGRRCRLHCTAHCSAEVPFKQPTEHTTPRQCAPPSEQNGGRNLVKRQAKPSQARARPPELGEPHSHGTECIATPVSLIAAVLLLGACAATGA